MLIHWRRVGSVELPAPSVHRSEVQHKHRGDVPAVLSVVLSVTPWENPAII